jgi:hypothetical protein
MNHEHNEKFKGFPRKPATNYWPYPKALNGWWFILTGSEQKVLDYILRRTWGFNKTEDFISMRQLSRGITTRSGKQLDRGCGIKHRKTLKKAICGLQKKGFINVIQEGGKTTYFQLQWDESEPLVQKVNRYGSQDEQVGGSRSEPTIKDNTIKDITITNRRKQNGNENAITQMKENLKAKHQFRL